MIIRQAQIGDFNEVLRLKKSLALDVNQLQNKTYKLEQQCSGFLIPSNFSLEKFKDDLKKVYTIAEIDNKVVGYLRIDEVQEMDNDEYFTWLKPDLKETYFANPHAELGGIAVAPENKHHGIASAMLRASEKQLIAKNIPYLFSFVVLSPVTNFPSMMFHEKNGFERTAVSRPRSIFGMQDYQSFLYGKKLI